MSLTVGGLADTTAEQMAERRRARAVGQSLAARRYLIRARRLSPTFWRRRYRSAVQDRRGEPQRGEG
mgnify:CR=1 FL=1